MERFHTTFTLNDNTHPQRRHTVRAEEVIADLECSVEEDSNQFIRHRSHELDVSIHSKKILRKHLGLHAYKIQLVQELKSRDHLTRRRFGKWVQNKIAVDPDFYKRIFLAMKVTKILIKK